WPPYDPAPAFGRMSEPGRYFRSFGPADRFGSRPDCPGSRRSGTNRRILPMPVKRSQGEPLRFPELKSIFACLYLRCGRRVAAVCNEVAVVAFHERRGTSFGSQTSAYLIRHSGISVRGGVFVLGNVLRRSDCLDEEHLFEHSPINGFLQHRHMTVSFVNALRPVAGHKRKRNVTGVEKVSDRINLLSTEIYVEDCTMHRHLLDRLYGVDDLAERADDLEAQFIERFSHHQ